MLCVRMPTWHLRLSKTWLPVQGSAWSTVQFFLGGVFRSINGPDVPAAHMSPPRAVLNMKDIARQAEMLGVPLTMPMEHPRRTVSAMRLLVGAPEHQQVPLMKRLFHAYWVDGVDIAERAVLERIADDVGVDVRVMDNPDVKAELFRRTAEAVDAGVFGVPAFGAKDRIWWGVDRVHLVANALGGEMNSFPATTGKLHPNGVIRFYHDFSSPFSYLASTQVERVAQEHGATVEWVPILLGALFREIGTANAPLLEMNASKAKYYAQDMQDWSSWWGQTFRMTPHFPLRTVLPLRIAILEPQTTPILYRAAWVEGCNIGDPEVVARVLTAAGFDGTALVAQTQQSWVKDALKTNTEEASAVGCCGVPSFWVNQKVLIWGRTVLTKWFGPYMVGYLPMSGEPDVTTLIVGDVHGCSHELNRLLSMVEARRIILVGDLFTKGPDPIGVWRIIREWGAEAVLENHDLRLLRAEEGTRSDTHARHVCEALNTTGPEWRTWLSSCALHLDLAEYVVVHAGLHPYEGVAGTTEKMATTMRRWPMNDSKAVKWHAQYDGDKGVVFGHDARQGLVWRTRGDRPWLVGLDTGCVYGGMLSGFIVEEYRCIQVSAKRAYCPVH